MIRLSRPALGLTAAFFLALMPVAQAQSAPACGLSQAAFCETFNQPQNGGTRSGDLNPVVWGVSRTTGNNNAGQGVYNGWFATNLNACDGTHTAVIPPEDVIICNGQLREASNDGHTVTTLAMYPKQPFDYAGRTGKIVFDVTNDTQGSHAMWPELWVTDTPAPAPFTHSSDWLSVPQNAFGVRMSANGEVGQLGLCPNGNNLDKRRWTVDSATIVRNYAVQDVGVTQLDCVIASAGPNDGMNHVEFDVSQNQIDVYATDAGTTAPLKHIAVISNANLSLTRGLVWLEDSHYNAEKSPCIGGCQNQHTFTWDNVGFDGPLTYHDLSFDALDTLAPHGDGSVSLGKFGPPAGTATWNVLGMPANPSAQAARVLFNFSAPDGNPSTINFIVNDHPHVVGWPYPDNGGSSWRTLAVTIPMTDLVAGTNVVKLGGNQALMTSNVNIVLVNVDGGTSVTSTPVPPTSVPTLTPAPTSTAIPTVVPTATVAPTSTCAVVAIVNGQQRSFTRPSDFCTDQ